MAQMPILRNYLGKNQKSAHQLKKQNFLAIKTYESFQPKKFFLHDN